MVHLISFCLWRLEKRRRRQSIVVIILSLLAEFFSDTMQNWHIKGFRKMKGVRDYSQGR